jgi:hypothetical protein
MAMTDGRPVDGHADLRPGVSSNALFVSQQAII